VGLIPVFSGGWGKKQQIQQKKKPKYKVKEDTTFSTYLKACFYYYVSPLHTVLCGPVSFSPQQAYALEGW